MFSGIIEQTGRVNWMSAIPSGKDIGLRMKVLCNPLGWSGVDGVVASTMLGESIAVDGVCLTVIDWHDDGFLTDLSPETLLVAKPFFDDDHSPIAEVNLERALRYGQLVGGHLVSGHVEGMGELIDIHRTEAFCNLRFRIPTGISAYLEKAVVPKGCIAINGVSLTINAVDKLEFTVMIIPHTLKATNLQALKVGDRVNLESDLMAKYVIKHFSAN